MKQYYHINNQCIIPNGVDLEKFSNKSTKFETFTFLAIGRLERVKNFQILVKTMRELDANTQLIIVGEGGLRESIEKLIFQYRMQARIKLLGHDENIANLMNQSHCLLIPSKWEGMPLVLLEAGAAHLPVIATPVGGIPIILDNDSGYIIPQEKFNEQMQFVYSHYELAEQKAQKFYEIVRNNYHIKLVSKRHSKLYEEVLIA
jgi:glycosyltransferase involved in cell wall biosynthesis